jgi:putative SOS response-associated peptidase YedK
MCGRYTLTMTPDEMKRLLRYPEVPNFPPRYNIAPTQPIPIIREDHGERHFHLVRWGLIPGWVKDPADFSLLINARAETVSEKPAFRAAMKYRRCLVPASGFYEWRREGKTKHAFFIRPRGGGLIAMAGIWEAWMGKDGSEIDTAAILTTSANRLMASIHDRMPVIIQEPDFEAWLDNDNKKPAEVMPLTRPLPDEILEAIPVSDRVNAVRNDDPAVQDPLSEPISVEPEPAPETRPAQGNLF